MNTSLSKAELGYSLKVRSDWMCQRQNDGIGISKYMYKK